MSESIMQAGKRLERLMENYLTYAQLELIGDNADEIRALRNHLTAHIGPVIYDAARLQARSLGRETDLQLDIADLAMRISEANMTKIISELVDNAFKFSEPGTSVLVSAQYDEQTLWIRIQDQGRGISHEQIQHMGAYMQFDRTVYEQQGLGLGFVIARRLVLLHKGRIHIESDPGHGTIIDIALPIKG
jgi:signal transduction histidine kinase